MIPLQMLHGDHGHHLKQLCKDFCTIGGLQDPDTALLIFTTAADLCAEECNQIIVGFTFNQICSQCLQFSLWTLPALDTPSCLLRVSYSTSFIFTYCMVLELL